MTTQIYWFRNDLRLTDNLAWRGACSNSDGVIPVYVHDTRANENTAWGFERVGVHRRAALRRALDGLGQSLDKRGMPLVELEGNPGVVLYDLVRSSGAERVLCEDIAAPEERSDVEVLRVAGIEVHQVWQSSLLDPDTLPFSVANLPGSFTTFRKRVEAAACKPRIPGLESLGEQGPVEVDAMACVSRYFAGGHAQTYKLTRDCLRGECVSSRWSHWLALGILSPHYVYDALKSNESERGANDSTYWLWFELLWRDYFRFLHLRYGAKLYTARGLSNDPPAAHNARGFRRWCEGETGVPLVDAGMRELAATGFLSNRMRQIVASYLIYDLGGDYRAGAAWFEHQLIDYDPYSNQGNWLYVAGRGTDPRGGRRFDIAWQTQQHDPDGSYRRTWS